MNEVQLDKYSPFDVKFWFLFFFFFFLFFCSTFHEWHILTRTFGKIFHNNKN